MHFGRLLKVNAYVIHKMLFDVEVLLRKTKGCSEVLEKLVTNYSSHTYLCDIYSV